MEFGLSLRLPEERSHIRMVRRMTRELMASYGADDQDIDDIETITGELASNAVCHSHDNFYTLELSVAYSLATIIVRDSGVGFSTEQVPTPGTARWDDSDGKERIGGFGIPMVMKLADRVDFQQTLPHGTTVRAEKRLR